MKCFAGWQTTDEALNSLFRHCSWLLLCICFTFTRRQDIQPHVYPSEHNNNYDDGRVGCK